jgi:hypothetical protein
VIVLLTRFALFNTIKMSGEMWAKHIDFRRAGGGGALVRIGERGVERG